ncbi:hypothetical protein GCM10008938_47240 [Deinococcus roseus]|uniref:Uncharacterized protein n=1 Tax=Deinococcus roseus TaxID=392414 RepID=A0ABQ2DF62_9DEIO|nr:hypothetical protein GCM10008938_47240 [Deinococcus roseus]
MVTPLKLSLPTLVEVAVTLVFFVGMVWSGERGRTSLAAWVYFYVLAQAALKTSSGTHLAETLPLIFLVLVTFKWAREKKMLSLQVQGWLALACLARVVFDVMQSQQ